MTIMHDAGKSVIARSVPALGCGQVCLTAVPRAGENAESVADRMVAALRDRGATPCFILGFGSCAAHAPVTARLRREQDWPATPVTWVEGATCDGAALGGLQVTAVTDGGCRPLVVENRCVGVQVTSSSGRACWLGGLADVEGNRSRTVQARAVFERMEAALDQADLTFRDVMRTWLYVDRILAWYDDFNAVRTPFFRDRGVLEGIVPASTGIGAANPAGAAVAAGLFAWRSANGAVTAEELLSPLQCSAQSYGSSFSRAVELCGPEGRQVLVSGTASIDPEGTTVHIDDIEKQTALTMDVIEAILASRGMGFADMTRAVVYVKEPAYAHAWAEWLRTREDWPEVPAVVAHADVCRDDLLFEVELDAASRN